MSGLSEKLAAVGISITFRFELPPPSPEAGASGLSKFLDGVPARMRRRRAERELLKAGLSRLGFWLEQLPNHPEWLALVEELLLRDRAAFVDLRGTLEDSSAWYALFDGGRHPELYARLRELRWRRAAEGAARYGQTLPHLLEGDVFSVSGYNLKVTSVADRSLRVGLLNEAGEVVSGTDLFHDLAVEPPVKEPRPLPRGARNVLHLTLNLLEDLQEHLDGKLDPQ